MAAAHRIAAGAPTRGDFFSGRRAGI